MKLKNQIFLISFFSCLFPLLTVSIVFSNNLEKEISKSEKQKIEITFNSTEFYLNKLFKELNTHLEILNEVNKVEETNELVRHMTDFSSRSDETLYYVYGSEDGGFYYEEWLKGNTIERYDHKKRPWYIGAMKTENNLFISDIFYHAITGEPIVTLSKKSVDKNGTKGVIAAIINLTELKKVLSSFNIYSSERIYIVSKLGRPIFEDRRRSKAYNQEMFFKMISSTTNYITLKGKEFYIMKKYIKELDLYFVSIVSMDELTEPINKLQKLILLLVSFTLIITSIFIWIFTNRFSDSLKRLAYIIDNISRGNYSKNIQTLTNLISEKNELFLVKEGINKMQKEISQREKKLRLISETDPLTNIYNRGAIMSILKSEIDNSKEFGANFTIIMFDLDRFKNVNDTYGHPFGDQVLKVVTKTIKKNIKLRDLIGRYGGEEFLILLPDTNLESGMVTAERVRKKVEELQWENDILITISLGVSEWKVEDTDDSLLSKVDKLLYKAKKNGRNRSES